MSLVPRELLYRAGAMWGINYPHCTDEQLMALITRLGTEGWARVEEQLADKKYQTLLIAQGFAHKSGALKKDDDPTRPDGPLPRYPDTVVAEFTNGDRLYFDTTDELPRLHAKRCDFCGELFPQLWVEYHNMVRNVRRFRVADAPHECLRTATKRACMSSRVPDPSAVIYQLSLDMRLSMGFQMLSGYPRGGSHVDRHHEYYGKRRKT